jgi:sulfite reductase beta subunit-like hemoprotein
VRFSSEQLVRITKVSDEYSTGRLHITTRQDIQIHYVSLDRTRTLGTISNRLIHRLQPQLEILQQVNWRVSMSTNL